MVRVLLIVALVLLLVGPLYGCIGHVNVNFCGPQDEIAQVFTRKEPNGN